MQIECDGQSATLTVSDDGPGVAVENLQRIFEKFQRGSSVHAGGLGLGLFVVQQIVQSHGGKVTVENLKPKGVKFSVVLPLNSAEAHP